MEKKLFLEIWSINILYPNMENMIVVPNHKKEHGLLWESRFHLFHKWTMIIRKMVEKPFLSNPKHQYHVSQYGEHDYSVQSQKNIDYYGNQVWCIWWRNFDYKENGRKESFSCKYKASISWIPMWRTWLWWPVTKRM